MKYIALLIALVALYVSCGIWGGDIDLTHYINR